MSRLKKDWLNQTILLLTQLMRTQTEKKQPITLTRVIPGRIAFRIERKILSSLIESPHRRAREVFLIKLIKKVPKTITPKTESQTRKRKKNRSQIKVSGLKDCPVCSRKSQSKSRMHLSLILKRLGRLRVKLLKAISLHSIKR